MVVGLIIRVVVLALAVWATTLLVPGFEVNGGAGTYLLVALVLGTINAFLGTLLRLLTLPLILLTLGVFSLVISAICLLITDALMDTFLVEDFWAAFFGAIVIAVVTLLLDLLLVRGDKKA